MIKPLPVRNLINISAAALILLGGFFVLFRGASAATEVGGVIASDEIWTVANSPYVVKSDNPQIGISIESGATLTIESGVVVKFELAVGAKISTGGGKMVANGAEGNPIIFTSILDDSVGGDTNGDGSATAPGINDWNLIWLGNASDEVTFSEIRYGTSCVLIGVADVVVRSNKFDNCQAAIEVRPGIASTIQENEFSQNGMGIYAQLASGLTIRKNKFIENRGDPSQIQYGIFLQNFNQDVRISQNEISNNEVGIYFEPSAGALVSENNISGNELYGILVDPGVSVDARNNWWGHPSGPEHPTNPGGLGDVVSDGVIFDPWLNNFVEIPEEEVIDPVIIIPGILGSEQKNGIFVIDPILHTYDDLIDTLKANGFEEGSDLFTFPYNWRQSNVLSAHELKNKIADIKSICSCSRVDLVAHSMGGLVTRQYIASSEYGDDVDQLIFMGTPHLGTPWAYLSWEGGVVGPGPEDERLQFFLKKEAKKFGFSTLYDYIRGKPILSVREALPIYPFLRGKETMLLKNFPDEHPQNSFMLNLDSHLSELLNNDIRITNIIGRLGINNTIHSYRVVDSPSQPLWEHGYPDGFLERIGDRGIELGVGDGRIADVSSRYIQKDLNVLDSEHRLLPTDSSAIVFKKLTGNEPDIIVKKNRRTDYKLLILKLLSPIDFYIVAPDGKRTGKDFSTGGEYDEIENSFYSGFITDDEYITILDPLDGVYKIITQGTGAGGEYTIAAGYITDEGITEIEFVGQAIPNELKELVLALDGQNPDDLQISDLDNPPPATTANPLGTAGSNGWYRSNVNLTLNAIDDNSGVLKTEYSLNGGTIWEQYLAPVQIAAPGISEVLFFSTDRAGNREENQSIEIKIDKWAPDASFSFNPITKDVNFVGKDDQTSNVAIQDTGNKVVLTDEGGNITTLNYKKIKKPKYLSVNLTEITYNATKVKLPDNGTIYLWNLDRAGNVNALEQAFLIKGGSVLLTYLPKVNKTLVVKIVNGKATKETLNGMIILKVKTMEGKIVYEH